MDKINKERGFLEVNVPNNLYSLVLSSVNEEKRRQAKYRFVYTSIAVGVFTIALIPASIYMINQFVSSNFYSYLTLTFSNGSLALSYWKDFSFVLAESFPIFAVSVFLATILALVVSILSAFKNNQKYFSINKLA